MEQINVRERIIKILEEKACREISDYNKLDDDLDFDSLDLVEVVMSLEKEFAIVISDDAAETVRTVKDVVDLVENIIKTY